MGHTRNIGLGIALAGFLWAAHREKCQTCGLVPEIGGYSLTKLGIAFYALALVANFKNMEQLPLALKSAAYAHGMLVVHMLVTHQVCLACILTAVGSIIATQN
jgi:hypothetical protein